MRRRGYAIYINTVFQGAVPCVTEFSAEGNHERICIFETEREAQLEIVDSLEIRLQQFKEGERDFEDAITVEEYVVAIEVLPDGTLVKPIDGIDEPG